MIAAAAALLACPPPMPVAGLQALPTWAMAAAASRDMAFKSHRISCRRCSACGCQCAAKIEIYAYPDSRALPPLSCSCGVEAAERIARPLWLCAVLHPRLCLPPASAARYSLNVALQRQLLMPRSSLVGPSEAQDCEGPLDRAWLRRRSYYWLGATLPTWQSEA